MAISEFIRGRSVALGPVLAIIASAASGGDPPLIPVNQPIARSDAAAFDGFGTSMVRAGDGVLVGCRGADGPTPNAGAVHYFRDLGDGLQQVQKITPSDSSLRAEYGHALAAAGGYAVVGVPLAEGGAGAVSLLTFSGGSWRQSAVLRSAALEPASADAFGDAVAVRADGLVAVGVPGATVNGAEAAGAVELFAPFRGEWAWVDTLIAADPVGNDRFGASLAFVGDRLVVGSPFDDAAGVDAGAVVLHQEFPVLGWLPIQTVTPAPGESLGYFGRRLAADGDRVVVGAPRLDAAGPDAGAVVVLQLVGDELFEEAVVLPPSPRPYDDFGDAVAIEGNRVVVGSPADPTAAIFSGSILVVDLEASGPRVLFKAVPVGSGHDFLGTAVGVTGPWVLGGAPLASAEGEYAGAVHAVDVATDCDGSGTPDIVEIWTEPGSDADGNGILDRCECPADIVPDGVVNGNDLGLYLIYSGGPCGEGTANPNCLGDLDGDGEVRGADLGLLLSAWGPCGS